MELTSEAEKQLNERLLKCRCCFRMIIDDRKAVNITDELRIQFANLCGIEVNKAQISVEFSLISRHFSASRVGNLRRSDLPALRQ
jgi:hypothetical protein